MVILRRLDQEDSVFWIIVFSSASVFLSKNSSSTWFFQVLQEPIINSYALRQDLKGDHALSGISALSGYSMLADDPFPTYALTKKGIGSININRAALVPPGEIPGCIVQKVGYWIESGDGTKIDPLSTALSISEEDKKDPRVEKAIEEMLEEYVW